MRPDSVLMVFCSFPDDEAARRLAHGLVERRLAACVQVLSPCDSVYRWNEIVEESSEVPLLIKTTAARYAMLEEALREAHPYELPEIVAIPVSHGLPDYLAWVVAQSSHPE